MGFAYLHAIIATLIVLSTLFAITMGRVVPMVVANVMPVIGPLVFLKKSRQTSKNLMYSVWVVTEKVGLTQMIGKVTGKTTIGSVRPTDGVQQKIVVHRMCAKLLVLAMLGQQKKVSVTG